MCGQLHGDLRSYAEALVAHNVCHGWVLSLGPNPSRRSEGVEMISSDDTGRCRISDDGRPFGYWPLGGPSLVALLLLGFAVLMFVNLAGYADQRIGISTGWSTRS